MGGTVAKSISRRSLASFPEEAHSLTSIRGGPGFTGPGAAGEAG
jgi:hypothetical protein